MFLAEKQKWRKNFWKKEMKKKIEHDNNWAYVWYILTHAKKSKIDRVYWSDATQLNANM